jgi:general secretion pathway protein K
VIQMRRKRGVALITALLITALAASVAAGLAWDNALDMRRTMLMLYRDQAIQVAFGAESWVQGILRDDLADSETDHLGEIWATELPGLPIDGGELFGQVEDLQGRFNINNLIGQNGAIHKESMEQFRRLLLALGLDPRFAGITADWIDSNQEAEFPDGAEDPIYSTQIPPYRTANQPLSSVSELSAISDMDKETFDVLLPHIVALPGRTAVNVNTATGPVLQSLGENMSPSDVERLLSSRDDGGFTDIETVFSSLVEPELITQLAESSNFFQLKVIVRIDNVLITYYTILERGPRGDVTPILRSLGSI